MIIVLLALLVLSPGVAVAQGSAGAAPSPAPAPAAPAPAPAAPAPAPAAATAAPSPPPTAESLVSDTQAEDIATASYYELVAWCQELGLDEAGSRKDLQGRLAQHYKVTLPPGGGQGEADRHGAVGAGIGVLHPVGCQREIRRPPGRRRHRGPRREQGLGAGDQGGQRDLQPDPPHDLRRRECLLHDHKGKETQNYTGRSFSFDLDTSEGVFYDGSTTKEVTQADTKLTYTFEGTTISRLENNTVYMQDGSFTTSKPVDPFWQIRARDVWILAPSEWAVDNAVLMVGRVPLLYIPAFFWPGDALFFNPNPGYDNRTGMYVQTTTYLIGRKTKEDNPFSFLQVSETGETAYREELRGLFLRKIPGESPPPDKGQDLKLLLDVYSRLGGFARYERGFSAVGKLPGRPGIQPQHIPRPGHRAVFVVLLRPDHPQRVRTVLELLPALRAARAVPLWA